MKVNFDGMRKNATGNMNNLFDVIESIIENDSILDEEKEKIENAFNEAAQSVDVFNCLSDNTDDSFNELDIEINRFDKDK